jgi:hypothetical protein
VVTNKGKTVMIDGTLYVIIAGCAFLEAYFGSDMSYKYIEPYTLFWLKGSIGFIGATALALKMFRSTAFSDNKTEKETADRKIKL